MMAPPRVGVIFDVDGVIADTEAVNAQVTADMLADEFGVTGVVRADFAPGVGRGAAAYVRAAAHAHGVELTDAEVDAATASRQSRFLTHLAAHPLEAFPGVLELIAAAETDRRFDVAIATSSTREKSEAVLRAAKVPFERLVYITGSDVTHKKPHPELFERAAAALGLPATRCVVIEDAPNGIAAAHAAGARCIAVTNSFAAGDLQDADRVVDSLAVVTIDDLVPLLNT